MIPPALPIQSVSNIAVYAGHSTPGCYGILVCLLSMSEPSIDTQLLLCTKSMKWVVSSPKKQSSVEVFHGLLLFPQPFSPHF